SGHAGTVCHLSDVADCSEKRRRRRQDTVCVRLTSKRGDCILATDVSVTSAPEPPGWDNGAAPVCFFLGAIPGERGGGSAPLPPGALTRPRSRDCTDLLLPRRGVRLFQVVAGQVTDRRAGVVARHLAEAAHAVVAPLPRHRPRGGGPDRGHRV